MKKIVLISILLASIILLIIAIRPIRTTRVMEKIAKEQLMRSPFGLFTEAYYEQYKGRELEGPVIEDNGNLVRFKWYKTLQWKDTAYIYVDVAKYPSSFSLSDTFFQPRLGMGKFYYYSFPNGSSKFEDILPLGYRSGKFDSSKVKLSDEQARILDSANFLVPLRRILRFLRKGYFTVVEKNSDFTVIDFYEPIATSIKQNGDSTSTISAKISLNDSLEMFIEPI